MNTEENTTESSVTAQVEAGTLLKQKRESLGLTQKQIADRLKLRLTVIEQIEENKFESVQVATFTRGYLRSYAKAVSLDEKIVLDALDHAGDAQHEEHEMQSFSGKAKTEKHNSRIMSLTWGIFAILVGISSVWWWQNQQQDTLSQSLAESNVNTEQVVSGIEASDVALTEELEPLSPVASSPERQEQQAEVADEVQELQLTDDVVEITEPVIEVAKVEPTQELTSQKEITVPAKTETPTINNELALSFSSDCWIQVKDADGKTLSTGIKKAGQSLKLSGTAPYKVVLGAPEGVSMTFASEPVDLSGYTSGKVARITLP
ncbi:cytoskeleton protein RodZ [Vibrio makurazakiensis]|uniref:cytoskeleton protein RodZ n=1 Tax=Vibrio makurazakiensis TaxID=2910250 RepID=UPI003D0D3BB3